MLSRTGRVALSEQGHNSLDVQKNTKYTFKCHYLRHYRWARWEEDVGKGEGASVTMLSLYTVLLLAVIVLMKQLYVTRRAHRPDYVARYLLFLGHA